MNLLYHTVEEISLMKKCGEQGEGIQEEDIEDLFYIPQNNWSLSTSIPNMSFLSYMVVVICSMKK